MRLTLPTEAEKAQRHRRQKQIADAYDRIKKALSENPKLYGRTTIGDCPALAECMEDLRRGGRQRQSRYETVRCLVEQESLKNEHLTSLIEDLDLLMIGVML